MSSKRYRLSKQLKFNIQADLERFFVNNGLYFNISSGYFDPNGQRADILTRVTGNLYESFYDNWLFETDASGVAGFLTSQASGVFIDGTFHARNSSPYIPSIDFRRGRVIFRGTSVPSNSVVSSTFTHKNVKVDFINSRASNLIFSQIKDMVDFTNNAIPSGLQRQLPRVIIDIQRRLPKPFSLGGAKTFDTLVVLHILSNTEHEHDQIVDLLTEDFFRSPIKAVDFNLIPEIFNDFGDVSNNYQNFTQLQNNTNFRFPTIYIDEVELIENSELHGLYSARIHVKAVVHNILSP